MCATTGDPQGWFATTHWTMVVSAGDAGSGSRVALEKLCEQYWIPLYSYVRRRGYSAEDAQDLTQEFFVRLVEQNRVARADREKGRFRSFLLASLKNFLSDEWDKARARKRGGGIPILPLQFGEGESAYEHEPVDNITPDQIYERRWALTVLDTVLKNLRSEQERDGKADLFARLSPCLAGERAGQKYADLARELDLTESAVKSMVHRLRRRYRDLLRQEIANTVATTEDIDDELHYLIQVLARG